MKLQIDTLNKQISIQEAVNLEDLFDFLERLLPNKEWKSYSISSSYTQPFINPIVVPYYPIEKETQYPWTTYPVYGGTTTSVHCVDINK